MHSLTHLVESICRRGVISASSTDCGEALHPQGRKDWARTNHQASAPDQVNIIILFTILPCKPFNRCCKWHMNDRQYSRSGQRWIDMTNTNNFMEVKEKPLVHHLTPQSQGLYCVLEWGHASQSVHMVMSYLKILALETLSLVSTPSFRVRCILIPNLAR